MGSSKSDFFGLNCFKISCDISFQKKTFFEPSWVVPLWALFSFFFLLSIFSFFLSFFFLFFISSQEKVSSFLFSCISFKYVSLLASVSEFNCFLRSRCSMEMWCPDDIGRDSWDWVGPPAWGEHASTPQSGVEAPRLLKRSLPRLYCCCCFGRVFNSVFVHSCDANAAVSETYWWQVTWESDSRRPRHSREPSTTKNSSSSRARKIHAPRDSTPLGRVRKMAQNAPKKPFIAPNSRKATCLCCELGCPPNQAMNRI